MLKIKDAMYAVSGDPPQEAGLKVYGEFTRYDSSGSGVLRWFAAPEERFRRGAIHEVIHALDVEYELGLTHDQVRGLAQAFSEASLQGQNRWFFESM